MYSQNNEEEIIIAELAHVGRGHFLDIGAWDGKTFSNTYRLAELGWGGCCVEPSPVAFLSLIKNHAGNPNIKLINAVIVAGDSKLVEWHDSAGDAVSTTSAAHRKKWETGTVLKFTTFLIYTMPVVELFKHLGFAFEFINIDVEDTNYELFSAMPWESLTQTKVICVEHDGFQDLMLQRLTPLGFRQIGFNGENLLLSRV
jgi:FkbM family methyltransferase